MNSLMQRQQASRELPTPFVSVVCPTWNRREFLPYLLYIWQYQDYPAEKRELIILDDSPESHADLVAMLAGENSNVRYVHSEERLALGKKRNLLNEMAKGEYILCFDDDDYYSPDKISWQVNQMQLNKARFSGCDQIYIWYSHLDKIYLTHPFGPKHALNGTFGLHRNLLSKHRYVDDENLGEEMAFLKGFTTPVLQVDPQKAILCISHSSNTYDKDFIMGSSIPVELKLEDFVTDENLLAHYRRLSKAPLNTQVAWQAFDKIAVMAADEATCMARAQALMDFGVSASQLVPVVTEEGELLSHRRVLEQAKAEGWANVLIFDGDIHFVKKENTVNQVNKLLNGLRQVEWQVLLLGGRYERFTLMQSLKGTARIFDAGCGCAYAVNAEYFDALSDAYRQGLEQNVSLDRVWKVLMGMGHTWLGFSPSFAFLQHGRDPESGKTLDCTHWFFRKPPLNPDA
ncbi:glycosyltransferase [Enterobacteriaceae bacterium 89]|nr:glycosyltransferase [Enterobacteriaceae bacterium 89]